MLIFNLCQYHKYSIAEVEALIPFERDIYVAMLQNHIEEENARLAQ
jgi:hypothetical protein